MDRIGKYEILGEIGAGGFGTVYRGRDPILKRMVAIKTCSSEDGLLRQRFRREAEIVAGLQHPNITTIHDLGEQDGVPYLVQEFLDGEDLSQIIGRRDDLSLEHRARLLFGVAAGLAHAHAHGIIHRDIKPGNIRVLSNGSVKVMDFGIAKIGDVQTELTRTGMMLGTGPYLAPEQLTDEQLDSRCDIFSFGVVAYELFTYQRPFEASTFSALLYKILHQPHTPIRELRPDLPGPLVELVERCLIKDRERRISTFEEIRAELAQVLNISEERKLPRAAPGVVLDNTVSLDSGGDATRGATRADENSATVMMSTDEASLAGSLSAEGAPQTTATGRGEPATSASRPNRVVPMVAGGIAVAVLAVAGALWLGQGDAEPTIPASEIEAAGGPLADAAAPGLGADADGTAVDEIASDDGAAEDADGRAQGGAEPGTDAGAGDGARASTDRTSTAPPAATAATPPPVDVAARRPTVGARTDDPPGERAAGAAAVRPRESAGDDRRAGDQEADARPQTPPPTTRPETSPAPTTSASRPTTASSEPAESRPPASTGEPERSDTEPPAGSGRESATREPSTERTAPATPPRAAEPERERAQPAAPEQPDPAAEEAGIRAALDRYRRAYEALDIDALSAAWPSLDPDARARIARGFASYQALDMTIDACAFEISGATAVARCTVSQEVTPRGGRKLTSDRQVEFRLAKQGGAWVIREV